MRYIKNTFLYINLYIIAYGSFISLLLSFVISYFVLNNYIIEYVIEYNNIIKHDNISEDLCFSSSFTPEVESNIYLDDKKGTNIMKMKKLGEKSTSIVSTNGSKNVTKLNHLVNTNYNIIRFDTNKYIQLREINSTKNPTVKIAGIEIELGQIIRNPNTDTKWRNNLNETISKEISSKAINLPDVKFTEEELKNRMELTTNIEERTKAIESLEKTQDPYKSKIFLDVKAYYQNINKVEYYESFLLDYYTSSDAKNKVDNIANEMKRSESAINTKYNKNNFANINSPEGNSAAFISTILNPYGHFCMYYYGPNGEEIFSTFTHASGIVDSRLNNNVLHSVFNNDYNLHLIDPNKDFNGDTNKKQYATSFIYQEKQIPGLINYVNLHYYNTLYSFINQQDVYKEIEKLVSLKYMSDSEIIINKLKQAGLIL